MPVPRHLLVVVLLASGGIPSGVDRLGPVAAVAQESIKDVLAAQIRSQGVVCNNALRAVRDAKRSKADHDVWVLTCENATYRVSRYPDLAARVQRLR